MTLDIEKTARFWAENLRVTQAGNQRPLNFWDVATAILQQRRIAFPELGDAAPEVPAVRILAEKAGGPLPRGLSIGCGSGHKELMILKAGTVGHFTLVEIVPELVEAARVLYAESGMADRARHVEGDLSQLEGELFDLVYFDSSLHHMADVAAFLPRVLGFLKPGGFFFMDDFVGPTYNQFPDAVYAYAEHVRRLLPQSVFAGPDGPTLYDLTRIPKQAYLDSDPSEACDSGAILPTIARHMPGVEIVPTGGLIYYLAGREIFHKLTEMPDRDDAIIRLLFELDKVLVRANPLLTCYALAVWRKPAGIVTPVDGADWRDAIVWPDWGIPL